MVCDLSCLFITGSVVLSALRMSDAFYLLDLAPVPVEREIDFPPKSLSSSLPSVDGLSSTVEKDIDPMVFREFILQSRAIGMIPPAVVFAAKKFVGGPLL